MANKVNTQAIEGYSKAYTEKLCDSFFGKNESISGKQILNLSNIQQVNLFAIKNLYESWKTDAENFRSPHFNFESPEVKQALQGFMNVVSQHILVKKENFIPILELATKETLMLIFYPLEYFNDKIRDLPNFTLTPESVAQMGKFIQINKSIPVALEERLNGHSFVYANEALHWLEDVCNGISFESTQKFVEIFSEKVPLDIDAFERKSKPFVFTPLVSEPLPTPTRQEPETVSFFDANLTAEPLIEKTLVQPVKVVEEVPPTPAPPADYRLNDSFKTERSLNDQTQTNATISDMHQQAAIAGVNTGISLNQKFIFINYLFKGDAPAYSHAIDELELCKDFSEAKELILRKYVNRYNWDLTSFEAEEFLDVMKRRFA